MYLTCAVLLAFLLIVCWATRTPRCTLRVSLGGWCRAPKKSCGACSPRRKAARPPLVSCCG